MRIKFLTISLLIALACFMAAFVEVKAASKSSVGAEYPTIGGKTLNAESQPTDYISYFYTLGLSAVGITALGALVYAGLLYMLSDTITKTEEAKKWIWSSLSGLVLALAAYLILNTINPDLVKPSLILPSTESIDSQ